MLTKWLFMRVEFVKIQLAGLPIISHIEALSWKIEVLWKQVWSSETHLSKKNRFDKKARFQQTKYVSCNEKSFLANKTDLVKQNILSNQTGLVR